MSSSIGHQVLDYAYIPANQLLQNSRGVYLARLRVARAHCLVTALIWPYPSGRLGAVLSWSEAGRLGPQRGRQFQPTRTARCVCMLVAPLSRWCDLGCCFPTVVVIKLRRTPPLHTLATASAPTPGSQIELWYRNESKLFKQFPQVAEGLCR